jgi:hypothetical protein
MTRSLMIQLLGMAVVSSALSAQRPDTRDTGGRPRVDPLTASIRGHVTMADTGVPVRGAQVRAMSESGVNRLATTDGDGRFELRNLPAGQFRVTVSKAGFVSLQFGQRQPFEPSVPIGLAEGQQFTANLALMRAGVIAGRVYDEHGEPAVGVRVRALRARMVQGRRQLQPAGVSDTADDMGAYRVYGLAPGEYYVAVTPGVGGGPLGQGLPIYYPGTADLTLAQGIALGAGGEAVADIQLVAGRTATVSGVVLGASGAPVPAMVNLSSEAVGLGYVNAAAGAVPMMIGGDASVDGRFTLRDVPPGPYSLNASYHAGGGLMDSTSLPLVIGSEDVTGVTLVVGPGGTMVGMFVRDAGVTRPLPAGLGVTTRQLRGGGAMRSTGAATFRLAGLSSPFFLDVDGLPDSWTVKAVLVDDADVTDTAIDLRHGQSAVARVVLTDRVTDVIGVVSSQLSSGPPSVIVFPDDAGTWGYRSRYVRVVRVDEQGRFRIRGLPPLDRYVAAAVDYFEDGDTEDSGLLERMRAGAIRFSLREGETRVLEVPLVLQR